MTEAELQQINELETHLEKIYSEAYEKDEKIATTMFYDDKKDILEILNFKKDRKIHLKKNEILQFARSDYPWHMLSQYLVSHIEERDEVKRLIGTFRVDGMLWNYYVIMLEKFQDQKSLLVYIVSSDTCTTAKLTDLTDPVFYYDLLEANLNLTYKDESYSNDLINHYEFIEDTTTSVLWKLLSFAIFSFSKDQKNTKTKNLLKVFLRLCEIKPLVFQKSDGLKMYPHKYNYDLYNANEKHIKEKHTYMTFDQKIDYINNKIKASKLRDKKSFLDETLVYMSLRFDNLSPEQQVIFADKLYELIQSYGMFRIILEYEIDSLQKYFFEHYPVGHLYSFIYDEHVITSHMNVHFAKTLYEFSAHLKNKNKIFFSLLKSKKINCHHDLSKIIPDMTINDIMEFVQIFINGGTV